MKLPVIHGRFSNPREIPDLLLSRTTSSSYFYFLSSSRRHSFHSAIFNIAYLAAIDRASVDYHYAMLYLSGYSGRLEHNNIFVIPPLTLSQCSHSIAVRLP